MTEHPDYPQDYEKLPSLKYIVEQVSKVEDVSNCSTGYYAAQKKTADKIEKLNLLLGQLTQTTSELKKVTDADIIGIILGEKTEKVTKELYINISNLQSLLSAELRGRMDAISSDQKAMIRNIDGTNNLAKHIQNNLNVQMEATIKRLDAHIQEVHEELITPLWKNGWFWLWLVIVAALSYLAGKGLILQ